MMKLRDRLNGATDYFRIITPITTTFLTILVTVLLWGFTEIRKDVLEIRNDFKVCAKEMLYKCDYIEDQKRIWMTFDTINERINKHNPYIKGGD